MATQKMFYKAKSPKTGNMWDVWLYHHEGTYYLYSLCKQGKKWNNFSMARSPDGVHWTEIGPVLRKGTGVVWMGTGSTWKSPNFERDGMFQINYSQWIGPRQTIWFAQSKDLVHWKKCGKRKEFVQDERWYEPRGRWDCIWTLPRPGGGLYGYWTATPKARTGGRFGFGESLDGVTWKALRPPKVQGVPEGEVGAIEKIGDRYTMMFGTRGGMMTLVADRPEGPFVAAKKNFVLLSGHTYFSRFFPSPRGLLVCHHSIARDGQVHFGMLKRAVVDREGTLRLGWWKGNEAVKEKTVLVAAPTGRQAKGPVAMLKTKLDARKGFVLEGTMELPRARGERRGLYVETGKDEGSAILLNRDGIAMLGELHAGTGFLPEKHVRRDLAFGARPRFRLLLRDTLLEFYLDDILIECFSLRASATGRIGLISGSGAKVFGRLRAYA
jgi:hypothetical protein